MACVIEDRGVCSLCILVSCLYRSKYSGSSNFEHVFFTCSDHKVCHIFLKREWINPKVCKLFMKNEECKAKMCFSKFYLDLKLQMHFEVRPLLHINFRKCKCIVFIST